MAWDPPVGRVDLDLDGQAGGTDLDLGGREQAAALQGAIAGTTGGVSGVVRVALGVPAVITGTTGGAAGVMRAAADPQLLSAVVGQSAAYWGEGARHQAAASGRYAVARLGLGAGLSGWRAARATAGPLRPGWRQSLRAAGAGVPVWIAAARLGASSTTPWDQSPRAEAAVRNAWQVQSHPLRAGPEERWHDLPRASSGRVAPWQDGADLFSALYDRFGDGPRVRSDLRNRWRDTALVWYVLRPPEPPEPPEPPVWSTALCLRWEPNGATLIFGRDCLTLFPPAIPRRRSYFVIHDIAIVRLPDLLTIPASALTIALDADSWAWSWSGTLLGLPALESVAAAESGEPIVLAATIDGYTWHLIVEDWQEDRQHGSRAIRCTGRGLSAWLGSPYELMTSGTLGTARTLQQAMGDRLPLGGGWTLSWWDGSARRLGGPERDPTPDWLLPAGAWSWSNTTPIQALHAAAQAVGLVVVPGMADRTLTVQPRYPLAPWHFWDEETDPDLTIPDSAILSLARRQALASGADGVYVHGAEVGGILARVWLTGTAGDLLASTVQEPLITHPDGARLLGTRLLAGQATAPTVRSLTLPLGGDFPLLAIGDLLHIEIPDGAVRGLVNAVSIDLQRSDRGVTVRQTLTIGEETPNLYARWRRLLPGSAPLLYGTVTVPHGDGTCTVTLTGGGTQRVRGDATAATRVWVRDGRIEGNAPTLPAYEIELI
jgi:hypothetical protein